MAAWENRCEEVKRKAVGQDASRAGFVEANATFVSEAIDGRQPFSSASLPDPGAGARAVANIASAHVPSFVSASRSDDPKPYKNGYDLGWHRVGEPEPGELASRRESVDRALPLPGSTQPSDVYFAAVDLNGTGVRFYGDVCLSLPGKHAATPYGDRATTILDRNSFELLRDPLAARVSAEGLRKVAAELAGTWKTDLGFIATMKVFERLDGGTRHWTPGQISDSLLVDEDYIEVLLVGSFSVGDLHDARLAADDAAHESLIADRASIGPPPAFESLLWRHQRRSADEALQEAGVPVRVVVTGGRSRS